MNTVKKERKRGEREGGREEMGEEARKARSAELFGLWQYTVETAIYTHVRPPLGAAKNSLKQQVVCERGLLRHAHAKSTLFFSLNSN